MSKASLPAVLAFDTSAYTSSVAVVDMEGSIIADERMMLGVKKGDRGLRQSQAFFQHMKNLPGLVDRACEKARKAGTDIMAVSASSRPRDVEGSYMPVFLAGLNTASAVSSALDVPLFEFSHQEGHIAAVAGVLPDDKRSLAFHLSGGTGEIVEVRGWRTGKITGGTADISFGQLIDRVGVAYGMPFPAGKYMDRAALDGSADLRFHYSSRGHRVYEDPVLSRAHIEGSRVSLSGLETSAMKAAEEGTPLSKTAPELFMKMSDAIFSVVKNACEMENISSVIFAGGVSSSIFLRREITSALGKSGVKAIFGEPALSRDNAVGTARLGAAAFRGHDGGIVL